MTNTGSLLGTALILGVSLSVLDRIRKPRRIYITKKKKRRSR